MLNTLFDKIGKNKRIEGGIIFSKIFRYFETYCPIGWFYMLNYQLMDGIYI